MREEVERAKLGCKGKAEGLEDTVVGGEEGCRRENGKN